MNTNTPLNLYVIKPTLASKPNGFTFIELMIALVIISILAAIAFPSYREYLIYNAEAQLQADMKKIEIDLNRWRASALSYQGFAPKTGLDSDGKPVYGYADTSNTVIYLPKGSTASDYKFKLTLVDGNNTSQSLIPTATTTVNLGTGRSWRMLAEPNSNGLVANAHRFLLTSDGLSCKNKSATQLTISSVNCGNGGLTW